MMNDSLRFATDLEDGLLNLERDNRGIGSPAGSICVDLNRLVADGRPFGVKLAFCIEALFGTCPYSLHVSGPSWSLEVVSNATGGLMSRELRNVPVFIPDTERPIATLSIGAEQDGAPIRKLKHRLELLTHLVGYILLLQFPELMENGESAEPHRPPDGPCQLQGREPK
jgi:hypothetical protein